MQSFGMKKHNAKKWSVAKQENYTQPTKIYLNYSRVPANATIKKKKW